MRIDLPGLEAFLSVANSGGFKRAATHLNLSQAALSHRITKLEKSLGVLLLARTTRQVALTPAGLELLPVAQKMIQEVSSTLDGLVGRAKKRDAQFAIGCLPTMSTVVLPSVLAAFNKECPQTAVQIYDNSAAEIANRVRLGEAEFGLTIVSAKSWDLEATPLLTEPFVLICAARHPFAKRRSVRWDELEGEPLIRISAEAGNRAIVDSALRNRSERMTWRYEVQHVATAIALVRAGVGLTVVPAIGLDAAGRIGLAAVALHQPAVARTLGFVTRRGNPLAPGPALLMKLIGDHVKASARDWRDKPASARRRQTR